MTARFAPLHAHTYWSTLDGLTSPTQMARRAVKIGATSFAVTDHGSIAGIPSCLKAASEACGLCGNPKGSHANNGKGRCLLKGESCEGFTPANLSVLAGCEFYVPVRDSLERTAENRRLDHLVCIAKNLRGWKKMLRAVSEANSPQHYYYKPRLSIERLAQFADGDWLIVTGHVGSQLANALFVDYKLGYRAPTLDQARSLLKADIKSVAIKEVGKLVDLFGAGNVGLEIQQMDKKNLPCVAGLSNLYRWVATQVKGVTCVATPDAHYAERSDAPDQRVLLCGAFNTTLNRVQGQLESGEDVTLGGFFKSDNYHVPSADEMLASGHFESEVAATLEFAAKCEKFDLKSQPKMSVFREVDGRSGLSLLKHLCDEGLASKLGSKPNIGDYRAQLNHELTVLGDANLHDYFLTVWDICRHSREKLGCLRTPGRGSAAGTLVGYLLDIHGTDPLVAKLSFERFYNAGRNSPGRIAMPDIDMDFPVGKRGAVIDYIRNLYGADKVAQIATFSTLQGRQALKTVLSAHGWGDTNDRNEITKKLPQDAAISDKLQEMKEETGTSSSIEWALTNQADDFREYVTRDEKTGELSGPLAAHFAQAMRLEGCKRGTGKHASGVIVSPVPLSEVCPLLHDKHSGQLLAGMEYEDLEQMGLVKLDVLGVNVLDKVQGFLHTALTGKVGDFTVEDGSDEDS